jgi:hypothetical protein
MPSPHFLSPHLSEGFHPHEISIYIHSSNAFLSYSEDTEVGFSYFYSLKSALLFYSRNLYVLVGHKKSMKHFGFFLLLGSEHRDENVALALLQHRPYPGPLLMRHRYML